MEDKIEKMEEKIEKLKKDYLISFKTTYGLSLTPGKSEYIVTKDKKLYVFEMHHFITPFMEKHNIPKESVNEYDLTEEQYNELEKFIEENIRGKVFEPVFIYDASYSVTGLDFSVHNYTDLYNKGFEIIKRIIHKK